MPSIHVRAALTWLAIFPLVALGMQVMGAVAPTWPPVLRAFAMTLVIVPLAVYLVLPRLIAAYVRLGRRPAHQ